MKKKRFCPIELSIVVFFSAIVLGVIVPNYISFQDGKRNQRVIDQAFSFRSAVEEYFLLYGNYPTNMSQLVKEKLLLADGLQNHFNGTKFLPKTDNTNPQLGEIVYQFLDVNKDGNIEAFVIIAYGKQFGELEPVAYLTCSTN